MVFDLKQIPSQLYAVFQIPLFSEIAIFLRKLTKLKFTLSTKVFPDYLVQRFICVFEPYYTQTVQSDLSALVSLLSITSLLSSSGHLKCSMHHHMFFSSSGSFSRATPSFIKTTINPCR